MNGRPRKLLYSQTIQYPLHSIKLLRADLNVTEEIELLLKTACPQSILPNWQHHKLCDVTSWYQFFLPYGDSSEVILQYFHIADEGLKDEENSDFSKSIALEGLGCEVGMLFYSSKTSGAIPTN